MANEVLVLLFDERGTTDVAAAYAFRCSGVAVAVTTTHPLLRGTIRDPVERLTPRAAPVREPVDEAVDSASALLCDQGADPGDVAARGGVRLGIRALVASCRGLRGTKPTGVVLCSNGSMSGLAQRVFCVFGGSLVVAVALSAPAVGDSWGPAKVFVPIERQGTDARAAVDSSGATVTVYLSSTARSHGVGARIDPGSGAPVSLRSISGPDPGEDEVFNPPSLVMNARGDAVAQWSELFSARLWVAVRHPGGRFRGPQQIGYGDDYETVAQTGPDGDGVVAYGTNAGLRVRSVGAAGVFFGRSRLLSRGSPDSVRLAVGKRGGALVSWQVRHRRGTAAFVAWRAARGRRWRVRRLAGVARGNTWVRSSMAQNGRSAVTWQSASSRRVRQFAVRGSAGRGFGRPVALTRRLRAIGPADIAVNGSGQVVAAFGLGPKKSRTMAVSQATGTGRFRGARRQGARGAISAPPRVSLNDAGAAVLSWEPVVASRRGLAVSSRAAGGEFVAAEMLREASRPYFSGFFVDRVGVAYGAWDQGGLRSAVWNAGYPITGVRVIGAPICGDSPNLASNATGAAVLAWSDGCGGGMSATVRASVRPPGGAFGEPVVISDAAEEIAAGGIDAAAVGPTGTATVVWAPIGRRYGTLIGADFRGP